MNDALEAARRELREALAAARRTLAEVRDATGSGLDPGGSAPLDPAREDLDGDA